MFGNKRKKEKLMEAIGMIRPTSKAALKSQCLYLCNLNTEKADKMYDFLIKGMEDSIPDVEPESKPFIQNFGEQANEVIGWFRENKDVLGDGFKFIQGIIGNRKGATPPTPLAPINE